MELVRHRKMKSQFKIHGLPCVVVPCSHHVIRIFYEGHVYDVLLSQDELADWVRCGTEWQKEYIRKLLTEQLIDDNNPVVCNASIADGYLA